MKRTLLKNFHVVTNDKVTQTDVLVVGDTIVEVGRDLKTESDECWEGTGLYLLPGVIDGQVHFRDPGLTHKGDFYTESVAAIAGGVTSIIDMPNTLPNVLTMEIWMDKHLLAASKCFTNFGCLMGVDHSNWKEWTPQEVHSMLALTDDGLYFSGKGKLLAQFPDQLRALMEQFQETIIALHCEDESLIEANLEAYNERFGENIPFSAHHLIRSSEACLKATQSCIDVAQSSGGRLHVLHVTSGAEAMLFDHKIPFEQKRITAEVCVQNLLFCSEDYEELGAAIKWNPAIKTKEDRDQLWQALLMDKLDLITTDHAPHLWSEKLGVYEKAMSGAPMIQHSLNVMVDFYQKGFISLEKIVEKMCHRPAQLYGIKDRGFISEGMKADLVVLKMDAPWQVSKENVLYKCGWSPLEGRVFNNQILSTSVNGHWVLNHGKWDLSKWGSPLYRQNC
jgi:dihydroorotase